MQESYDAIDINSAEVSISPRSYIVYTLANLGYLYPGALWKKYFEFFVGERLWYRRLGQDRDSILSIAKHKTSWSFYTVWNFSQACEELSIDEQKELAKWVQNLFPLKNP